MHCNQCGLEVPENYKFCPKCGAEVTLVNNPVENKQDELTKRLSSGEITRKEYDKLKKKIEKEEKSSVKSPKRKMSKKKKAGIGIAVFILAFFVLGIIGSASSPNSSTNNNSNNAPQLTPSQIKSSAMDVTYDDLMRHNESYVGKIIHFDAQLTQVQNTYGNNYDIIGMYGTEFSISQFIWLNYSGERFLQNDHVEVWGTVKGLKNYETVLHSTNTVPEIDVLILELKK